MSETRRIELGSIYTYEQVVEMWRRCITTAYEPEAVYQRFAYNREHTYPNQIKVPNSPARTSKENIRRGLTLLGNILIRISVFNHYRKTFWKMAYPKSKSGNIENMIHTGIVGHHLIQFATEFSKGEQSACFYSQKLPSLVKR